MENKPASVGIEYGVVPGLKPQTINRKQTAPFVMAGEIAGIAEFALKLLEKKADYVEVRLNRISSNSFLLKNGVLQFGGTARDAGIGIRYVLDGKMGFLSTDVLTEKNLRGLVSNSFGKLERNTIAEHIGFAEEPASKARYEVKQKKNFADIGPKEKVKFLLEAERAITETKLKMPLRYLVLLNSFVEESILTSEGTSILAKIPKVHFWYILGAENSGKSLQHYWGYGASGGWEFAEKWNIPELLKREAIALHRNLKEGTNPPSGEVEVVCGPQVTGIMVHESVGHPYEADRMMGREAAQAGETFVTREMMGARIASEIVNVVDDPTLENSYGFFLYDNEGVKAGRKWLIKDGLINGFLHNRQTAKAFGIKSNGSSRAADYDKEPIVRMSNTFLLPGEYKEDELFEGIKLGVYIKNFMEWNIDDKRFNQKYTGAEAYLIKNGKLGKPVRNPIIEITTPKLWQSVDAVANNLELHAGDCGKGEPMQGIPVYLGGPSIRLRNVRLSS